MKLPALFLALKRNDTPALAKLFAFITVGYALSPIDLVPDYAIPIVVVWALIVFVILKSFFDVEGGYKTCYGL